MKNLENEQSCINFIWCINAEKWGTMEKILEGKNLEIQDVIPNFAGNRHDNDINPKYSESFKASNIQTYADYYYAQDIASWAINNPDHPVRLVYHPIYIHYPGWFNGEKYHAQPEYKMQIDNSIEYLQQLVNNAREHPEIEIKDEVRNFYEYHLQDKYHTEMNLDKIESKFDQAFQNFESQMHEHGYDNFSVIKFRDLCNENLAEEDLLQYPYLQKLLDNRIDSLANNTFDYLKSAFGYFGFGYEKNIIMDLDVTPLSMNIGGQINFDSDLMLSRKGEQLMAFFTEYSHHDLFKNILDKVEQYSPHDIVPCIENLTCNPGNYGEYQKQTNVGRLAMDNSRHLSDEYYMNNITRMGHSYVVDLAGEAEPIIFEENYWPQDGAMFVV